MAKRTDLPDGLVKRGKIYHVDFRSGGRRIRKTLSRDLTVAKQLLIELRARLQKGDYGLLDNNVPVEELQGQYLQHCRQTLDSASVERYEQSFRVIGSELPVRVSQITPKNVLNYREKRLAQVGAGTVNYDVDRLETMLRWGVENGIIASNPLEGIDRLPETDSKETRALTEDEAQRLLNASPAHWSEIWYSYLVTGMRKNELASLLFRDIDWDAREVDIRRGISKNHKARRIPIDEGLWETLLRKRDEAPRRQPWVGRTPGATAKAQERFTKDHVFTTPRNTRLAGTNRIYCAFIRCCNLAGIQTQTLDAEGRIVEHVDVHSLRVTFATHLILNRADPKTVQELLGHRTLEMTMKIYAKTYPETKRAAIGRLPWGRGAQTPSHLVQFAKRPGTDRQMSSAVERRVAQATT